MGLYYILSFMCIFFQLEIEHGQSSNHLKNFTQEIFGVCEKFDIKF